MPSSPAPHNSDDVRRKSRTAHHYNESSPGTNSVFGCKSPASFGYCESENGSPFVADKSRPKSSVSTSKAQVARRHAASALLPEDELNHARVKRNATNRSEGLSLGVETPVEFTELHEYGHDHFANQVPKRHNSEVLDRYARPDVQGHSFDGALRLPTSQFGDSRLYTPALQRPALRPRQLKCDNVAANPPAVPKEFPRSLPAPPGLYAPSVVGHRNEEKHRRGVGDDTTSKGRAGGADKEATKGTEKKVIDPFTGAADSFKSNAESLTDDLASSDSPLSPVIAVRLQEKSDRINEMTFQLRDLLKQNCRIKDECEASRERCKDLENKLRESEEATTSATSLKHIEARLEVSQTRCKQLEEELVKSEMAGKLHQENDEEHKARCEELQLKLGAAEAVVKTLADADMRLKVLEGEFEKYVARCNELEEKAAANNDGHEVYAASQEVVEQLKEEVCGWQDKYSKLNDETGEWKDRCSKLNDEMGEWKGRCSQLNNEICETKERCLKLEENAARDRESIDTHVESLSRFKGLHEEYENCKMHCNALKEKVQELEETTVSHMNTISRLKQVENEVHESRNRCKQLEGEVLNRECSRAQLRRTENELEKYKQRCVSLEEGSQSMTKSYDKMCKQYTSQQQQTEIDKQQLAAQQQQLSAQQQQLAAQQRQLDEYLSSNESLTLQLQQNEKVVKSYAEARSCLEEIEGKYQECMIECRQSERKYDEVRAALSDAQYKLSTAEQTAAEARSRHHDSESKYTALVHIIECLCKVRGDQSSENLVASIVTQQQQQQHSQPQQQQQPQPQQQQQQKQQQPQRQGKTVSSIHSDVTSAATQHNELPNLPINEDKKCTGTKLSKVFIYGAQQSDNSDNYKCGHVEQQCTAQGTIDNLAQSHKSTPGKFELGTGGLRPDYGGLLSGGSGRLSYVGDTHTGDLRANNVTGNPSSHSGTHSTIARMKGSEEVEKMNDIKSRISLLRLELDASSSKAVGSVRGMVSSSSSSSAASLQSSERAPHNNIHRCSSTSEKRPSSSSSSSRASHRLSSLTTSPRDRVTEGDGVQPTDSVSIHHHTGISESEDNNKVYRHSPLVRERESTRTAPFLPRRPNNRMRSTLVAVTSDASDGTSFILRRRESDANSNNNTSHQCSTAGTETSYRVGEVDRNVANIGSLVEARQLRHDEFVSDDDGSEAVRHQHRHKARAQVSLSSTSVNSSAERKYNPEYRQLPSVVDKSGITNTRPIMPKRNLPEFSLPPHPFHIRTGRGYRNPTSPRPTPRSVSTARSSDSAVYHRSRSITLPRNRYTPNDDNDMVADTSSRTTSGRGGDDSTTSTHHHCRDIAYNSSNSNQNTDATAPSHGRDTDAEIHPPSLSEDRLKESNTRNNNHYRNNGIRHVGGNDQGGGGGEGGRWETLYHAVVAARSNSSSTNASRQLRTAQRNMGDSTYRHHQWEDEPLNIISPSCHKSQTNCSPRTSNSSEA